MHNITVMEPLSMGCLKEIQVLRKAEKMHGLFESLTNAIVTVYGFN